MKRILAIGFFVSLFWLPAPAAKAAGELVPHRALYTMSLIEAHARSGITGANGAMMYRFEDACDAWTSETKVILKLVYSEGEEVETTWSFTSWEAKDGLSYRFNVQQSRNGEEIEILEGQAKRKLADGPGTVRYSVPQDKKLELPDGTLFPTRHLAALIEAGKKNKLMVSKVVFDGASLDNPYQISALITKPAKKEGLDKAARLVRMAFFPVLAKSEEPKFELGITYRPDGIADHIRQDFGDFSLDLIADNIEVLNRPDC
ncbi:MAG: DUF1849 family protein [Rhodospirillales bacterium]|nr:DUF1849 family protein [Rhodospirillales bacterium]